MSEMFETHIALGSASDFVRSLYRSILGRDPDPFGLQHFTSQVEEGRARGDLLASFRQSDEARLSLARRPSGQVMADLAFARAARIFGPLIEARIAVAGDATDMWRALERAADDGSVYLAQELVEALVGKEPGWVAGYNDGAIVGWASESTGQVAELFVNGRSFSTARCIDYRQDLADAGFSEPACGFRFPIHSRAIDGNAFTSIHVTVGANTLLPPDRFVSLWLDTRARAFQQVKLHELSEFRTRAFTTYNAQ